MARRPTALQRRLDAELAKMEPQIRDAFIAAMQSLAGSVDRQALLAALEAGDIGRAVQMFRLDQSMLWPLDEAMRGSYIAGGLMTAAALPTSVRGSFGFNGRHFRAEAWLKEATGKLAEILQKEAFDAVQATILSGLEAGRHSSRVALDLVGRIDKATGNRVGGIVGLNGEQAKAIARARAILEGGDPAAIKALLRSRVGSGVWPRQRNAAILRELEAGKVSAATIEMTTRDYTAKALLRRGKTIAKDQASQALASGRQEGFQQLVDSGKVRADQVVKKWQHNLSTDAREEHAALDGTSVPFDGLFYAYGAAMQFPQDPAGGPENNLNCRCTCSYLIDFIGG